MSSVSPISCNWDILDYSHRTLLGACILIFGLTGVIFNGWLASSFLHLNSGLLCAKSHILILNLCVASLGRGLMSGFPFTASSSLAGRWLFGATCCQLFGFLKQMLGSFQMAALTSLAVERFLLTRPKQMGKPLRFRFYVSCITVCWIWSLLMSMPPVFGFGHYGCDVTGASCDLDFRPLDFKNFIFNIIVVIFNGVVPVIITLQCLFHALKVPEDFEIVDKYFDHTRLTKTCTMLTAVTYLMWVPQGLLTLGIISGLLTSYDMPVALAIMAPLGCEAAAVFPVLSYLAFNERLKNGLLGKQQRKLSDVENKEISLKDIKT